MRILDYQRKPNAKKRGNPRRKMGLADQLNQQQVLGPAVGPNGPESRNAPGNGPVPFDPTQGDREQSNAEKQRYGQMGTQFLGLPGMFLSNIIPDRIGDAYQQRRNQKEAMLRRMRNPGNYGQDGGMSEWDAQDQGSYIPRNVRPGVGGNRQGWRQGHKYPDRAGLGTEDDDYQEASRPRARLSRVMGPGSAPPVRRKKRSAGDAWLG